MGIPSPVPLNGMAITFPSRGAITAYLISTIVSITMSRLGHLMSFRNSFILPCKSFRVHPVVMKTQHLFNHIPDTSFSASSVRDIAGNLFYFTVCIGRANGYTCMLHNIKIRNITTHEKNTATPQIIFLLKAIVMLQLRFAVQVNIGYPQQLESLHILPCIAARNNPYMIAFLHCKLQRISV